MNPGANCAGPCVLRAEGFGTAPRRGSRGCARTGSAGLVPRERLVERFPHPQFFRKNPDVAEAVRHAAGVSGCEQPAAVAEQRRARDRAPLGLDHVIAAELDPGRVERAQQLRPQRSGECVRVVFGEGSDGTLSRVTFGASGHRCRTGHRGCGGVGEDGARTAEADMRRSRGAATIHFPARAIALSDIARWRARMPSILRSLE
jgi:hypothetical protein